MIIGMSLPAFTTFHVILGLIGVVTGITVVFDMLSATRRSGWTASNPH
jgi:hypothetical protein